MAEVRHLGPFPWCIPESTAQLAQKLGDESIAEVAHPSESTLWPVSLTLPQMMTLYWRVKTLRLTTAQPSVFKIAPVVSTATTEKDLVCFGSFPVETSVSVFDDSPTGSFGELAWVWDYTIYDKNEQRYYIGLLSSFSINNSDPFSGSSTVLADSPIRGFVDFFGGQIAMRQPTEFNYSAGTVTAEEYWPYDPNDGGGPIYDSESGAQLRPFP